MCLPSSPYQRPPINIAPTPPILQPLSFTSEPIMDLNDLMSSAARSAVTLIPPEPAQRIHHVQSDCGHYGSPRLNRSHSLLRNFSLRSRNSFSLHTRQTQGHSLSVPRPANARSDSAPSSTLSGSSLLSVWKKWRAKSVTNLSTLDGLDAIPASDHPMSCPQGPARKRSLFLPVGRLIAPFQIPSLSSSSPPSSDDLPCVIIVSFCFPFYG